MAGCRRYWTRLRTLRPRSVLPILILVAIATRCQAAENATPTTEGAASPVETEASPGDSHGGEGDGPSVEFTLPNVIALSVLVLGFLMVMGAGVYILVWYIVQRSSGEDAFPPVEVPAPRWRILDVVAAVVLFLGLQLFVSYAVGALWPGGSASKAWRDSMLLLLSAGASVGACLFAMGVVCLVHHHSPRALGITSRRLKGNVARGVLAYVAVLPVFFASVLLAAWLVEHTDERLLFEVDVKYCADLDEGRIPQIVFLKARNARAPLSRDSTLSIATDGSVWQITSDRDTYIIRREADKLNVYSLRPRANPAAEIFLESRSTLVVGIVFLVAALIAPVTEELFFRGFLYAPLRYHLGVRHGILLSAGLFALMHFNLLHFLPLFILGLLLTYLYEKTQSLPTVIVVHMLHNLGFLVISLFAKSLMD